VYAGNATGSYYATGGYGYVGQLIGNATAIATSIKSFGSVASTALAYGIIDSTIIAGNSDVTAAAASAQSFGGTGIIGGFVGTATATAYSKSPFNGKATAKAEGIYDLTVEAGDAYNSGTGPAKTIKGEIGTVGPIVGTGTASATTKGGGKAESYAYAYGVNDFDFSAADAETFGGGNAIAKNA
jgi:hypothetical protein